MERKKDKRHRIPKKLFLALSVIFATLIIAYSWMAKSYDYKDIAKLALESNDKLEVEDNNEYFIFTPKNIEIKKGFIFYPGAKVEAEAYAPICSEIAEAGYKVVIARMPLNFAIFKPNKAEEIINSNKDIGEWAIGGHSLGGVMACSYAVKNDKINSVILYASYPASEELLNTDIDVLSIWGSKDGVANIEKIRNASLPKDTEFFEIEGGNHAQFGDYGEQVSDNKASITNEEQFRLVAEKTIKFLNEK